jgi:rare lipoprotein A
MNNSIPGSLGLIATLFSITAITAQPQAGLAQPKSVSLEAKVAKIAQATPAKPTDSDADVLGKIGEQPAPGQRQTKTDIVAKVHTHEIAGVQAATIYVRNIPVLTFTMAQTASNGTKLGTSQSEDVVTRKSKAISSESMDSTDGSSKTSETSSVVQDPTARASAIAAKLNQLYQSGVDAKQISVAWKSEKNSSGDKVEQYVIKADRSDVVTIDAQTYSPDTSKNLERDALQVTNRLRRLLGGASPVSQVDGKPKMLVSTTSFSSGSVLSSAQGWASWYGPGFDGNYTASGEVFNQNALTAAHPSLPMGTQVRVTNLDTGRTVLVRINDRGPYHGGRILDLSAGAARVIGVMDSGVAPIRLEVMGR